MPSGLDVLSFAIACQWPDRLVGLVDRYECFQGSYLLVNSRKSSFHGYPQCANKKAEVLFLVAFVNVLICQMSCNIGGRLMKHMCNYGVLHECRDKICFAPISGMCVDLANADGGKGSHDPLRSA